MSLTLQNLKFSSVYLYLKESTSHLCYQNEPVLFKEIIYVYSKNQIEPINTPARQKADLVDGKAFGAPLCFKALTLCFLTLGNYLSSYRMTHIKESVQNFPAGRPWQSTVRETDYRHINSIKICNINLRK
jgi:hypothetical protein